MPSHEAEVGPFVQQQELIDQIAIGIAAAVRKPWASVVFDTDVVYTYAEELSQVTYLDGEVVPTLPPDETSGLVAKLRAVMYRPGTGTWFSFSLSMTSAGRVDAAFDYDNEPAWADAIDPVYYVQDLERYPRDEAHIPEWLALELTRGRAQDAEYDKTVGSRKRIAPITESL